MKQEKYFLNKLTKNIMGHIIDHSLSDDKQKTQYVVEIMLQFSAQLLSYPCNLIYTLLFIEHTYSHSIHYKFYQYLIVLWWHGVLYIEFLENKSKHQHDEK